jgi:hypothetical protein
MSGHPMASDGDRPSQHGARLGKALSAVAELGRKSLPDLPECCLTCAFREGTVPNMTAGTLVLAMRCSVGTDPAPFGCHQGMRDDQPTQLCAGYVAAKHAFETDSATARDLLAASDLGGDDDLVGAQFDAWRATTDPALDVYQVARAWAAHTKQMGIPA